MQNASYRALAVVCLVTVATVGCARSPVTGPSEAKEATTTADEQDLSAAGGVEKVTICHIPPGNPDNAHEITVGAPAVPAHLAHGDNIGNCGGK